MFTPPFHNYQHSHNIILELAYNFGIPLSLLVSTSVIALVYKSFKKINEMKSFIENYSINLAFLVSTLVFLLAHLTDVTYYDGKISILICILFAGLTTLLPETNFRKNF